MLMMCFLGSVAHVELNAAMYRVSQKSRSPTTFNDMFAGAQSLCIKFYTLIRNLYPHKCTDFRLFVLTFNEIALILLQPPIILRFQVWIVQRGIKMQSFSLTEMTLLVSGVDSTADFLNKS